VKVGAYTLDLYCDNEDAPVQKFGEPLNPRAHLYNEFPHNYVGQTLRECVKTARRDGWLIGKERQLCPKCNRRGRAHGERVGVAQEAQGGAG